MTSSTTRRGWLDGDGDGATRGVELEQAATAARSKAARVTSAHNTASTGRVTNPRADRRPMAGSVILVRTERLPGVVVTAVTPPGTRERAVPSRTSGAPGRANCDMAVAT